MKSKSRGGVGRANKQYPFRQDACATVSLLIFAAIILKLPALKSPSGLISANCQQLVKGKNQENLSKEERTCVLSTLKAGKECLAFPKHQRSPCRQDISTKSLILTRCFALARSSSLDILSRRIALVNCSLAKALSRSSSLPCFSLKRQERTNLEKIILLIII